MYCKHCGKQIADDSTFCQYCGGKVDAPAQESKEDSVVEQVEKPNETEQQPAQEVIVTTKESQPIQVEVSKKTKDNNSTIADEIVGNLKMIVLALTFFIVYMIGFILVHQKDIKKYDYPNSSYFGESCYDPKTLSGNWKFNWEEHYYDQLYFTLHRQVPFSFESPTPKQCLEYAESLEKQLKYNEEEIKYWKTQAKDNAKRDKQDWTDTINMYRRSGFDDDVKKNATYASIICLVLCVLGRYIVKLTKWVGKNKTE